jgi:hypothetical protein
MHHLLTSREVGGAMNCNLNGHLNGNLPSMPVNAEHTYKQAWVVLHVQECFADNQRCTADCEALATQHESKTVPKSKNNSYKQFKSYQEPIVPSDPNWQCAVIFLAGPYV